MFFILFVFRGRFQGKQNGSSDYPGKKSGISGKSTLDILKFESALIHPFGLKYLPNPNKSHLSSL